MVAAGRSDRVGLIERETELREVDGALDAAIAQTGSLLLIDGPAGIGKTAILEAAAPRAEQRAMFVLRGRGAELEQGFPYGLVRQLFEPLLRTAPAPRRKKLLSGAAAASEAAVLGSTTEVARPLDQFFSVVHGLYWLLANLSAKAPVALLLDDVHLADRPSLRFLAYVVRRLDGLPAVVIASLRSGEQGADARLIDELRGLPAARSLAPSPLTDEGVASLLAEEFGTSGDPAFVRACVTATGGNPFYVRELAATLLADGIAPAAEAGARIAAAAPPTIAHATLTRMGRQTEHTVELARAIAVLDADATLPRAAALASLGHADSLRALDALSAAGVISLGQRLAFRHPIVRNAIYDDLSPGARSTAHMRAAELLQTEGAVLDTVAAHLLASEPVGSESTVTLLAEAAAHAVAVGAPESAVTYLTRALAEGPDRELRVQLTVELAQAEQIAGHPSAVEHFAEARALSEDPAVRARAALGQAWMAFYLGEWQRILQALDDALAETGADQSLRMEIEALRAGATMYDPRLVHDFDDRRAIYEQLAAAGGRSARPLMLVLAACAAQRGEPADRARDLVEAGWDGGRFLSDGGSSDLLPQGIGALQALDELDAAEALLSQWLAAAGVRGSPLQYLLAGTQQALNDSRRGDLTRAAAQMREGLKLAIELGLHVAVPSLIWYCEDVLIERTDTADIAALAETIELGPLADVYIGAMVLATRARLRFAAGNTAAAMADIRRAGVILDSLHLSNSFGGACWRSTLALMLDRDQRDEALALASAELSDARGANHPRRIGVALRALGLLISDHDVALEHLREAVAVLANSPAPLEHARALVELGAAHRRIGERAAARDPLHRGLDLATRCGATRLADRARTELAASGARPRRERITGRDALTPSELRVAQLAAEGHGSREIAQLLFVTTRTVDTHLAHAYTKLGINSRKDLAASLTSQS